MVSIKNIITEPIEKKIILITGQVTSGKSSIARISASLGEKNLVIMDFFLENLWRMYTIGALSSNTFKILLDDYLNKQIVNRLIGRGLNLKINEESSIYRSGFMKSFSYLKKIFTTIDKKKLMNEVKKKNEIILTLHDGLPNIDIFFNTYKNLKVINVNSDPVHHIYGAVHKYNKSQKKVFSNFDKSNLDQGIRYKKNNKIYHPNFYKLNIKLQNKNFIEKMLYLKKSNDFLEKIKVKKYKKNKNFLNINLNEFILNKKDTINKISNFLNKKINISTLKLVNNFVASKKEANEAKKKFILSKLKTREKKIFSKMIKTI